MEDKKPTVWLHPPIEHEGMPAELPSLIMTTETRARVVNEALTWIGTPYRGWSCVKGAGTDCGQLLYGVYHNCGLLPELKLPTDYSLQVAWHRESTEYIDLVAKYFREIPESEVQPGDIVVYKQALAYSHAAIIIKWPEYVLHAVENRGVSGAHGIKFPRFGRCPKKFFTLKDVNLG